MHPAVRIIVPLVMLFSAVASYHSSTKLRRDGVLNLYPFPRVGRASKNTWQVPLNDYYLDYEPAEKRQLYAFPRVGRSDSSYLQGPLHHDFQSVPARRAAGPELNDSPGMWFGPRLGRAFKNQDDEITMEAENTNRGEPEQVDSPHEDRKKRQTKLM